MKSTNQNDKATARLFIPWAAAQDDDDKWLVVELAGYGDSCRDVTKPGLTQAGADAIAREHNERAALDNELQGK
jgi:hypothetical protein